MTFFSSIKVPSRVNIESLLQLLTRIFSLWIMILSQSLSREETLNSLGPSPALPKVFINLASGSADFCLGPNALIFLKVKWDETVFFFYQIVSTNSDDWITGSLVISGRFRNNDVPAIKRSCNSLISVIRAADFMTSKLRGYSI
jgi:hypothetical protein